MLPSVFTEKNAYEFETNGFTVIKKGFPLKTTKALLKRIEELKKSWNLNTLQKESKPFTTIDQTNRSSDEWFLQSGDKIRPFFEEEEEAIVNKIGHALHELDPVFRPVSRSSLVKNILKGLRYEQPVIVQSMFIEKGAKVGGEVSAHQDSTFLITNPHSICGIWIALAKATTNNGCMYFVKGSHKKVGIKQLFIRDPSNPTSKTIFLPDSSSTFDCSEAVPVEAEIGDVVIFHGAVVHFSAANRSNIPRPAYTIHISEKKCGWDSRNWLQSRFLLKNPLYQPIESTVLPIIDLSNTFSPDLLRLWDIYMSEYGFAIIIGHGIENQVIDGLKREMKQFFRQNLETKLLFKTKGYGLESGYNPFAAEAVGGIKLPDPIESFYFLYETQFNDDERIQQLSNAIVKFREQMDEKCLIPILKLSALSLGLDQNTLVKEHENIPYRTVKLSHYPPTSNEVLPSESNTRYGAHTDYEGFTFVVQDEKDDENNGLQVLLNNGKWFSLPKTIPNSIVVNAGDYIPMWTRGRWISPMHRVQSQDKTRDRYSIPYFTGPNLQTIIRPLIPDFLDTIDGPQEFQPIVAGDWLNSRIASTKVENVVVSKL